MRTVALPVCSWLAALACVAFAAGCPGDTASSDDTFAGDTAVPDTGDSDTLTADTLAFDSVAPDTIPPDTSEPDTVAVDTATPDTGPADTSDGWAPPRCGDAHLDFGEQCDDGDDQHSDTLPDRCRTDCQDPRCGDGVADTGETCDDGDDDDYDGCTAACEAGAVVATPQPGELLVSELMIDPDAVADIHGEWIELYNAADVALNLAGCVVHDDGTDAFTLAGPGGGLLLPAGDFIVLAPDGDAIANGGVEPDFVYTTMLLDNVADEVVVRCDGAEVDRVGWTALGWLLVSGRSLSLDPTRFDAGDNDVVGSWCGGVVAYGEGDLGTPGADNSPCFQLDTTVDRCVLTMPAGTTGYTDHPVVATVSVGEFGVTDLTDGVDISPNLHVELGHGPTGTDPAVAAWTWLVAEPTPGWQGGGPAHLDGYQRGLVFAAPIIRDVAARASRDGGATWSYCDRAPGAADGYSVADAASLTVVQSPCQPGSCASPEAPTCAPDGVRLDAFDPDGACVPSGAATFDCVYTPVVVDCGASGQICEDGACGAQAVAPALAGEVVVSELLIRPAAVTAAFGQWIELTNASDHPLDLAGCTLTITPADAGATPLGWTVPGSLVLPTGRRDVVGASADPDANGGAPVALAWDAGFLLPTSAFALAFDCGGVVIDAVPYGTGTGWPGVNGASASLSPYRLDAAGNDASASWCVGTATFGAGDRGTPGAPNPECPGDVATVDSCWLLGEPLVTAPAGVQLRLVARVIEAGITSRTVRTDGDPRLIVRIGLGPAGARPGDAAWTWFATAPDSAWIASSALGTSLTEDRYFLQLAGPAPGLRDVLAEVTVDGGNSWSLCDLDAVVPPAEEPTPQQLETTASACYPDPCGASPGHVCEVLDPGDAGPPTVVLDLRSPAVCALDEDDAAACSWLEDVVEDCADLGAECQDGACANFPVVPLPGDAVLSELMIVPTTGALGEWLEISNPGSAPLDLSGCRLQSGAAESWTWPAPALLTDAVVAPGAAVVVARSATSSVNGGVAPRAVMSGVSLGNVADWVALECAGELIDLVAWNVEDDWTIPPGEALALAGNRLDAGLNDFPTWWCAAPTPTPNVLNPLCPPPDTVLDDCVVIDPGVVNGTAGVPFELAGRLLDLGVTDVRPGPDPAPGTVGQLGLGPVGSDPAGPGWRWAAAAPDLDWSDGPAPGWDQWTGSVAADVPGSYAAAFRFSSDAGATWRYCDVDGGGYDVASAALVGIAPGVCVPNPCTSPPANTCSGNNLVGSLGPGTCSVNDDTGAAECAYAPALFSCAAYGGCAAATGTCGQPPAAPVPGDLIINEIMRDSLVTNPDKGEWIELRNTTAAVLDLRGCEINDAAGRAFTIAGPVPIVIFASGYYLTATSKITAENGTLGNVGWAWGDAFSLANTNQTLVLQCNGVELDRVQYAWNWPSRTGYAMQLHNGATAAQNDDVAWWCEASAAYGGGNRGTPRAANKLCQGVPIDP